MVVLGREVVSDERGNPEASLHSMLPKQVRSRFLERFWYKLSFNPDNKKLQFRGPVTSNIVFTHNY